MIVMEGMMLVPPERGTLIGRASWKPRYVVLGDGAHLQSQNDLAAASTSKSTSARKALKATSSKPSLVDVSQIITQEFYISVYKTKGHWEHLAQHPISAFKSCEIRNIAHRKQNSCVPTLMLELKPDTFTEKQRKRRSSRTGGISSGDPWADILLFRTIPEERYSIYDWQITVKPHLSIGKVVEGSPLSPQNPDFSCFTNPFAPREVKRPDSIGRPEYQTRSQSNILPHARDRPSALISPSPSLRSRRSDISSQASSQHPPMGFTTAHLQTFNHPTDLPSPASTSHDTQATEGRQSNQGRTSALSSHTRGSNCIASATSPNAIIASTPPGSRETILDRAFQMRCIPGSERVQDDEKVSSIARFEALMREQDERRQKAASYHEQDRSGWEVDEFDEEPDDDDLNMSDHEIDISTPAQRALDYISGRRTPPQTLSPAPTSPPIPFLNQGMTFPSSSPYNSLRPRTGSSQRNSRPNSLVAPSRSMSTTTIPSVQESTSSSNGSMPVKEKRRSSSSVRRLNLNFQEFAKRLSSTSSLLLGQTNASSHSGREGSRRGSVEFGGPLAGLGDGDDEGINTTGRKRNSANLRGGGATRDTDTICGWNRNVGIFGGGEGTFI